MLLSTQGHIFSAGFTKETDGILYCATQASHDAPANIYLGLTMNPVCDPKLPHNYKSHKDFIAFL